MTDRRIRRPARRRAGHPSTASQMGVGHHSRGSLAAAQQSVWCDFSGIMVGLLIDVGTAALQWGLRVKWHQSGASASMAVMPWHYSEVS